MERKTGWLCERFCLLCAAVFCGVISVQSILAALGSHPLISAAGGVCAAAVLVLAVRFWPVGDRNTCITLFLVRFGLAMAVILLIGAQPVQDFSTMYTAAQDMARGGRDYLENVYYYNWAYQTGFVFYESLLLRLFGPGQLSLQVMNAVWLGGTGVLVFRIALRLLPRRAALGASLLFALYPAPYFLAAVLTNQHIAAFFYYLAVWILLGRKELSLPRAALAGGVIALGNVMRPIGIILVLAALCWAAVEQLLTHRERWGRAAAKLAALAGTYFLVFSLCSQAIAWSGLNPQGLTNNQPMWKFVLGLNPDSSGGWNRTDYDSFLSLPAQEADQAMRQAVRERLGAGPAALARLAVRKSAVMWGAEEYMFWGFGHLDGQRRFGPATVNQLVQVLCSGDKGVYSAVFLLALAGAAALLRRGSGGQGALLPAFLLCGYYGVHLIVEVQSRYRYFLMPAVFLLAGFGLAALTERFYNLRKDDL